MRFLRILFCKHRATVIRWADGKMFVSCLDCPFDSPGVIMGSEYLETKIGAQNGATEGLVSGLRA